MNIDISRANRKANTRINSFIHQFCHRCIRFKTTVFSKLFFCVSMACTVAH